MKKELSLFYSKSQEMKCDDSLLEYMSHIRVLSHQSVRTDSEISASDMKKTDVLSVGATSKFNALCQLCGL